jgi:FkbM family methyltransferase
MKRLRALVNRIAHKFGFDIRRRPSGLEPFKDAMSFLHGQQNLTFIDIGANVGQTAKALALLCPSAAIHSFEPSPSTYDQLRANCRTLERVRPWNCAVGSSNGNLAFGENTHPDMSSFLQPGDCCWGTVEKQTQVSVVTLDTFAHQNAIDTIDLLKSDTQGYEMEVLKGAAALLSGSRIRLVYFEFIFSQMYENLPAFDDAFRCMRENRFSLVGIYQQHKQRGRLGWADFLFVHNSVADSHSL